MTTDKQVEEPIDLKVNEELDGSATVDLPDNMVAEDTQDEPEVKVHQEDDVQEDPNETRVQRNRRKQKRDIAKAVSSEKELQLNLLRKQNEELMARLSVVERKTHNADLARIEKAIEDQETRVNYAKIKMSEAMSAGDGDTYNQAQEIWLEARNQVSALKNVKEQASRPQVTNSIPDPRLQKHATEWMERNAWYNPNGSDTDTRIAKIVDEELSHFLAWLKAWVIPAEVADPMSRYGIKSVISEKVREAAFQSSPESGLLELIQAWWAKLPSSESRKPWVGTALELREVLTTSLETSSRDALRGLEGNKLGYKLKDLCARPDTGLSLIPKTSKKKDCNKYKIFITDVESSAKPSSVHVNVG